MNIVSGKARQPWTRWTRWNCCIPLMPFENVNWHEMTTEFLIHNLICFHTTEVVYEGATRDFMVWARIKYKTKAFPPLTKRLLSEHLKQFASGGYRINEDPLKIELVEF